MTIKRAAILAQNIGLVSLACLAMRVNGNAEPLANSGSAAQQIGTFAQTWSGMSGYTAAVTVFERKDIQAKTVTFDYRFSKPSSVTAISTSGPNAGVKLTWDGGSTVVARRTSGLASLFAKKFGLHDSAITTARGSSIDQISFGAILAHIQQQTGSFSPAAAESIDGAMTEAVTFTPTDPSGDGGLTQEVLHLSSVTHLPVRVLGFEGPTLVRQIDFSKVIPVKS